MEDLINYICKKFDYGISMVKQSPGYKTKLLLFDKKNNNSPVAVYEVTGEDFNTCCLLLLEIIKGEEEG